MTEDIVEAELENALCAPSWDKALEHIHAAQAALAAIRDTHAIVPREPTEAMVEAGFVAWHESDMGDLRADCRVVHSAMIAAAEGEG